MICERRKRDAKISGIMKWIAYWDRKVQKLGILELKMAQAATI